MLTAHVYRRLSDAEEKELLDSSQKGTALPLVGEIVFVELPAVGDTLVVLKTDGGGFNFDAGDREYTVMERIFEVWPGKKQRVLLLVDAGE